MPTESFIEVGHAALAASGEAATPATALADDGVLLQALNASTAMRRVDDAPHILNLLVTTARLIVPTAWAWAGRLADGAGLMQAAAFDPTNAASARPDGPVPEMAAAIERWADRLTAGQAPFEYALADTPLAAIVPAGDGSPTVTIIPLGSETAGGALVVGTAFSDLTVGQRTALGLLCNQGSMALDLVSAQLSTEHTRALLQAVNQLNADYADPEQTLQTIVRSTANLLDMDAVYVMIPDSEGLLRVRTAYGITRKSFYDGSCRIDQWFPGAAIRRREVVYVSDLASHPSAKESKPEGLRSTLCAPLFFEDELLGVLIGSHREVREPSREDRQMLSALASAAAVAIGNARLNAERMESLSRLEEVNRLIEEHSSALERTMQFQQRLTSLVLQGSGLEEVVRAMTDGIDRRVLILDPDLSVLHSSGPADKGPELDLAALRKAISSSEKETVGTVVSRIKLPGEDGARILLAPLDLAGEHTAYVVVAEGEELLDGPDLGMTEAAVTAVGLELMRDRASAEAEARLWGGLFQALLVAEESDEPTIARRASYLGFELSGANVVIAVRAQHDDAADPAGAGLSLQAAVQRAVRRRRETPTAVFEREGTVFALLTTAQEIPLEQVKDLCSHLRNELERSGRWTSPRIAHAGPHDGIPGIRKAVEESEYAIHAIEVMGRPDQGTTAFDELGIWTLLGRVGNREHLRTFADGVLGPLIAHDAERNSQLIETLRTLVHCNFHYRSAAEALFAHPNTLRYRISRIGELTGLDLNDGDDRLNVEIALRILEVMDAAPRAGQTTTGAATT